MTVERLKLFAVTFEPLQHFLYCCLKARVLLPYGKEVVLLLCESLLEGFFSRNINKVSIFSVLLFNCPFNKSTFSLHVHRNVFFSYDLWTGSSIFRIQNTATGNKYVHVCLLEKEVAAAAWGPCEFFLFLYCVKRLLMASGTCFQEQLWAPTTHAFMLCRASSQNSLRQSRRTTKRQEEKKHISGVNYGLLICLSIDL